MPTAKPSQKGSTEVKFKQKRKDAEDVAEKEAASPKPNKRARKDNSQPETQSNTKPPLKSAMKPPKKSSQADKSHEKEDAKALTKPSKQAEKTSKAAAKPKKKAEKHEESASSDEESAVSIVEDDENDEDESGEDEENYHLTGFSSEEDSSDEEVDQNEEALDVSKLPSLAKDDVALKKRLDEAKSRKNQSEERGVIYLGRIPHGFYEDEMRSYFSQFGDVTRLRLSRNKKTGHSKHYAFIEFSLAEVAQIVSETMHNYLLMGHILQCRVIPKDQIHPELWVGANRKWRLIPRNKLVREKHNKLRTPEEQAQSEKALLARQRKKQKAIKEKGIDYDMEPVAYKRPIEASS